MENNKPIMPDNDMYRLLREDKIEEFNARRHTGEKCDLRGTDMRGLDLRNLDPKGLDLGDTYLRQTDLRGLNLLSCNLEGASLYGANISGTYFPRQLSSSEIRLSREFGIRMRYTNADCSEEQK